MAGGKKQGSVASQEESGAAQGFFYVFQRIPKFGQAPAAQLGVCLSSAVAAAQSGEQGWRVKIGCSGVRR